MSHVEQDPMGLVIFWVTVIFAFALFGRAVAKRFNQPGVLGELLAGVIVGNLLYFFGVKLFIVLREGATVFNIIRDVLDGATLDTAVHAVMP